MTCQLLLDEMFSDAIPQQVRANGHDCVAVVSDPALVSLPDEQVLAYASGSERALVTANIKDFMPLDGQYRAAGRSHAGVILVSTATFRQDRSFVGAVASALVRLSDKEGQMQPGQVIFLARQPAGPSLRPKE